MRPGLFSKTLLLLATMTLFHLGSFSQDTFSIVAIDSITGEIGSAGASCVGSSISYPHGAQILSDVIPGVGVIHTQAAWSPVNQQNAHNWMMLGLSPQQIIDSLVANDATNNPATRQYGIVDYNGGHPRSAGYTGISCMDYKNDTSRLNYAIQGNILLGQQILDSMQSRFLNATGPLGDRLMAALQGAKVIGADTRCAPRNTSSQSAFIRVAKLNNQADSLYLDLWMAYPQYLTGIYPADPIDSLQTLYDQWKTTVSVKDVVPTLASTVKVYTDPSGSTIFDFTRCIGYLHRHLMVFDMMGRTVFNTSITGRIMQVNLDNCHPRQILGYRVVTIDEKIITSGTFLK